MHYKTGDEIQVGHRVKMYCKATTFNKKFGTVTILRPKIDEVGVLFARSRPPIWFRPHELEFRGVEFAPSALPGADEASAGMLGCILDVTGE